MRKLENRHFISDQKIIESLISRFDFLEADNEKWTKRYLDKSNNNEWLLFFVNSQFHGGGLKILGQCPFPDIEQLIDIALNSEFEDEVIAICKLLIDNEKSNQTDFRLILIDKLERISNKSRQNIIISETQLTSPMNRKDIIGKSAEQINNDSKYFQEIANRATQLI